MKKLILTSIILACIGFFAFNTYPIDGYELTGIKRLLYWEKVKSGEIKSSRIPAGAYHSVNSIQLNLTDRKNEFDSIPPVDDALQSKIDQLFKGLNRNYSLTVLDMTEGKPLRYAQHREKSGYQPGSVGKLVVLASLFQGLDMVYPKDKHFKKRRSLLKSKHITAGKWAVHDHHTIPVYNEDIEKLTKRTVNEKDVFTLFEWLDHMVSVSNNGAASVVWRESLLMHVFKEDYPELTYEQAEAYFKNTPRADLATLANDIVNAPLRDLGISKDEWRLGSFFTHGASSYIPGKGGSIGSPIGLIKFVLALEKGEIIDEPSSLEMKRLIYLTDRRIRYAASKKLDSAAVYFKSGSLYKCDRNKNPNCGKYQGNVSNYMNSVAIVEQPDGTKYAVCLMSNVLGKNSAYDHLSLASKIDDIMRDQSN